MDTLPAISAEPTPTPLSMGRVVRTWWPLAASWLLMSLEQPAANAIVARLAQPEINLAAWGSVVYPLCLVVESPIIMLLAASTALCRDWESYRRVRRFMMWAGAILTTTHALIAFTPLYYVIAVGLIGAPAEIIEPARVGLMIMTPWTWSIAFRRFNQGVMIRFGHSRAVGTGTLVRLGSEALLLAGGYLIGSIPGAVVAACAVAMGVVSEAIYAGLRVRPVLREQVRPAPSLAAPPTLRTFLAFYVPLAMTSLLYLLIQPIGSAALSRMPHALESLAAWPVVSGLIFILRSPGVAYTEVVVALLGEPRAMVPLRRFAVLLTVTTTLLLLVITATPLATFWFQGLSALPTGLAALAGLGLWIALPMPGLTAMQNWYQGAIVHSRRTRGITEAMALFLLSCSVIMGAGVVWRGLPGLYVGLAAFTVGMTLQTAWLWWRSRPTMPK